MSPFLTSAQRVTVKTGVGDSRAPFPLTQRCLGTRTASPRASFRVSPPPAPRSQVTRVALQGTHQLRVCAPRGGPRSEGMPSPAPGAPGSRLLGVCPAQAGPTCPASVYLDPQQSVPEQVVWVWGSATACGAVNLALVLSRSLAHPFHSALSLPRCPHPRV